MKIFVKILLFFVLLTIPNHSYSESFISGKWSENNTEYQFDENGRFTSVIIGHGNILQGAAIHSGYFKILNNNKILFYDVNEDWIPAEKSFFTDPPYKNKKIHDYIYEYYYDHNNDTLYMGQIDTNNDIIIIFRGKRY